MREKLLDPKIGALKREAVIWRIARVEKQRKEDKGSKLGVRDGSEALYRPADRWRS